MKFKFMVFEVIEGSKKEIGKTNNLKEAKKIADDYAEDFTDKCEFYGNPKPRYWIVVNTETNEIVYKCW